MHSRRISGRAPESSTSTRDILPAASRPSRQPGPVGPAVPSSPQGPRARAGLSSRDRPLPWTRATLALVAVEVAPADPRREERHERRQRQKCLHLHAESPPFPGGERKGGESSGVRNRHHRHLLEVEVLERFGGAAVLPRRTPVVAPSRQQVALRDPGRRRGGWQTRADRSSPRRRRASPRPRRACPARATHGPGRVARSRSRPRAPRGRGACSSALRACSSATSTLPVRR